MMFRSKKQGGFSLVELMVVLAIMGAVMGLTGGLVTSVTSKQEKQVEIEKVKQLFKQLSYKAYYSGETIQLSMLNDKIDYTFNNVNYQLIFKQITFVPENYQVKSAALTEPNSFGILQNSQVQRFSIKPLFETYDVE